MTIQVGRSAVSAGGEWGAVHSSPAAFGSTGAAPELEEVDPIHGDECVYDVQYMRAEHMKVLDEWRDEVVRDAERYYKSELTGKTYYKSLQVTCMDCHSNKTKFCDKCHNYASVDPFCWDCHLEPKESN